jgi:hypothetical protein
VVNLLPFGGICADAGLYYQTMNGTEPARQRMEPTHHAKMEPKRPDKGSRKFSR